MPPPVFFAQLGFAVGDLEGNRARLLSAARKATHQGAAAMLSPELSLCGYSPEDLLLEGDFLRRCKNELQKLIADAPPIPFLVGLPWVEDGKVYDAAALIRGGRLEGVYKKEMLPNESVFDECRYFSSGDGEPLVFESGGAVFAAQVCADIWHPHRANKVAKSGADYILALNASPFHLGKHPKRLAAAAAFAKQSNMGIFYCNAVGGYDDLTYDGASFYADKDGIIQLQLPALEEYEGIGDDLPSAAADYPAEEPAAYRAIQIGLRDYAAKTGLTGGAVLGLSGGIDSALVATMAADALGGKKITALFMPSRHTSDASQEDAKTLAENLGLELITIPLEPMLAAMEKTLSPLVASREGIVWENLQARLRGQLVMAAANHRGLLPLATGNKSEIACGYATLYGDMCGGFAPLADVCKSRVWQLAKWRNKSGEVIPKRTITRAPTAELRDNQTDQQTLPPYEKIDDAIAAYVENGESPQAVARRHGDEFASRFFGLLAASEHKRRQAAFGTKITARAFGRDWRMPVANAYRRFSPADDSDSDSDSKFNSDCGADSKSAAVGGNG